VYCIWIFNNKLDLNPETSFYYTTMKCLYFYHTMALTLLIHLRNFYAIFMQFLCNFYAIFMQFLCNFYAILCIFYTIFTQFYTIFTQFLRRVLKRPSTSPWRRRRRKTSTKASPETSINASGKASPSPNWTENIFPTVGRKSFWLVDVTNLFTSVIYEYSQ
jgi:hypothetical protein